METIKQEQLKAFARNLRTARKNVPISQVEISTKLQIAPSAYNRYEAGINEPGVIVAARIANLCGVSLDSLLEINKKTREEKLVDMLKSHNIAAVLSQESGYIELPSKSKQSTAIKVSADSVESFINDSLIASNSRFHDAFYQNLFQVAFMKDKEEKET